MSAQEVLKGGMSDFRNFGIEDQRRGRVVIRLVKGVRRYFRHSAM